MKINEEIKEQSQNHSEKKTWNPHRLVSEKDFERNLYLIVSTYLRMKGEGRKYTTTVSHLIEHIEEEAEEEIIKEENEEIEDVDELVSESRTIKV